MNETRDKLIEKYKKQYKDSDRRIDRYQEDLEKLKRNIKNIEDMIKSYEDSRNEAKEHLIAFGLSENAWEWD